MEEPKGFFASKRRRKVFNCIQVEVTSRCFLDCIMCPLPLLSRSGEWLPLDLGQEAISSLMEASDLANLIYLSGWGEPLLRPDLPDLVRELGSGGAEIGFTTNGVLMRPRRARALLEAGLDLVSFSLAGSTEEVHGAVRKGSRLSDITGNIRDLLALRKNMGLDRPRVLILFLMLKENVGELPEMVELAYELGVDGLVATNMTYAATREQEALAAFSMGARSPYARHVEEAEARAKELGLSFRAYPLEAEEVSVCDEDPLNNVFITADGLVGPCVYLNMPVRDRIPRSFCGSELAIPRLVFGDLRRESLLDIWWSSEYVAFRRAFRTRAEAVLDLAFLHASSLEEARRRLEEAPLPPPCRTCYKAYGL
ncbi:hypothetical protein DRO32_03810 [Candidatus Bathyarchaeota archaeon]|nr:MAG: hypothetical protein DRO32_03810 [Candidatus Bathyarchaeota archaeon]